jgi:hypothetical protein
MLFAMSQFLTPMELLPTYRSQQSFAGKEHFATSLKQYPR